MAIAYHYCAIKQMPNGTAGYSDGILSSDKPLEADDILAVRKRIAEAKGWEDGAFNITSLTRL